MTDPITWKAMRSARRAGESVPVASENLWVEIHLGHDDPNEWGLLDRLVRLRGWHCFQCWKVARGQ